MTLSSALRTSILLLAVVFAPLSAAAQTDQPAKEFSKQQLDQMLAPVALYPDDLLSNVLVASTYPLEIVQAARWRKEPANAKLKGDALAKALEAKDWDPSIKSLCEFPDVLQTMSDKLDWTQKLGDAFLAQQEDVMNEIQFLRQKADQTGSLKTNTQQKVTKQDNNIIIEPASPGVVYVPVYQPTVVYGPWWYPDYPPYYWYWGRPSSAFVSGIFWGAGFAIGNSLWGWGRFDWGRRDINIDVDRYNRINVNRAQITSNKWTHDPKHRGKVPYRGKEAREKYGKAGDKLGDARKDFRGFDKDNAAKGVKDKLGEGAGQKIKDRVPDGGADKVKQRLSEGGGQKAKDKVADRAKGKGPDKARSRDVKAPAAMDVKRGSDVRKSVNRGGASRQAASRNVSARPANVNRGGGGGRRGGGGGGGRGGGGRRR